MNAFKAIPDTGSTAIQQAWSELGTEAKRLENTHLAEMFAADPERFKTLNVKHGPMLLDYSKQRLDAAALDKLGALADACDLKTWIGRLFSAEPINSTENRAAMHWALRVPADTALHDPAPGV